MPAAQHPGSRKEPRFFFEGIEAEHVDSSTAYQNRLLTEMVRNFVGMDLQRQEAFCKVVEALVDHVEAE